MQEQAQAVYADSHSAEHARTKTQNAATWARWEATLTSPTRYANPYRDVRLTVRFAGPDGREIRGCGFWDGGNTFRLRCMFPAPGTWEWRTTCSDTSNAGLHDRTGRVNVSAYSGTNPLYRRGYLRISGDARHLVYDDGTPFLWVGDTPWSAFVAATQPEWASYVQDRKAKKFTVLLLDFIGMGVAKTVGHKDRNGNLPFENSGDALQWNPPFWRGVDEKVQYANEQGVVCVLANVKMPAAASLFPLDDAAEVRRFAQSLAARLMGNVVVYSPTADYWWLPMDDVCGDALQEASSVHLVTAHPEFNLVPAQVFHGKPYIDFAGLQTGGGWTHNPHKREPKTPFDARVACRNAIEWPSILRDMSPRKPVLNLEGVYDTKTLQQEDPQYFSLPFPSRMPRSGAYLSFFSGAMGHIYGCWGVWNWGIPQRWNGADNWNREEGIAQPSSTHIRYFAEFLDGIEWWRLEPRPDLIRNQATDWLDRMALAKTPDGDLAVAYLPDNEKVDIDMTAFPMPMLGRWYNPASGDYTEIGLTPNNGVRSFVRPAAGDWVLLLTASPGK
ncbi:MAG: DUF4038 domain-containing protein [Kiritimatiellae bacterium]|nr:DUF4038 domain-containing protein [Kiritimatiellia bacterium]